MLKTLHGAVPKNGHIDSSFDDATWTSPIPGQRQAYWFLGDEETGPVVICSDEPAGPGGAIFPVHAHACDSLRIIIDGQFAIGRKIYSPGEMRAQEAGRFYGPEVSQNAGCRQIIVFANRQELWATLARDSERRQFVESGSLDTIARFFEPVMGPDFYVIR